jgi:hypothetical protein
MTMMSMTKAAFARLCGVSKPGVAKWIREGRAVLDGDKVDVVASAAAMAQGRKDGVPPRLAAYLASGASNSGGVEPRVGSTDAPAATVPPAPVEHRRDVLIARLRALDWAGVCDVTEEGERGRVLRAATAVGLEAVESGKDDDGHWGGWQLRNLEVMESRGLCFDAVHSGHGFELDTWEALRECREVILHPDHGPEDMGDLFAMDLDLLPALAYPFNAHQKRPTLTEQESK